MNQATGEAVGILVFLLPGFVSIAVFHWLTPHRRPGVFGQIVQALMFTALAQTASWAAAAAIRSDWGAASTHWTEAYPLLLSVPFALFTGVAAAAAANHDLVHRPLRRLGVTMETSYPSEWYAAFSAFARLRGGCYVVLHLDGERRIYGRLFEWPSRPDEGHFRMLDYQWLTDESVCAGSPRYETAVLSWCRGAPKLFGDDNQPTEAPHAGHSPAPTDYTSSGYGVASGRRGA